jgi:hypothetical protein
MSGEPTTAQANGALWFDVLAPLLLISLCIATG